jgi:chorismate--pyruvate lyase
MLLGIPHRQQALVREVILLGCDTPWVFARSVIPLSTLTGRLRSLSKLDNRPLGALLFQDPNLQRSNMEVARISSQHRYLPPSLKASHQECWGRRSKFLLDNKPLLVSEVFLDPSELA